MECSENVTSKHLHSDVGQMAFGNGVADTVTEKVFDTSNTYEGHISCKVVVANLEANKVTLG